MSKEILESKEEETKVQSLITKAQRQKIRVKIEDRLLKEFTKNDAMAQLIKSQKAFQDQVQQQFNATMFEVENYYRAERGLPPLRTIDNQQVVNEIHKQGEGFLHAGKNDEQKIVQEYYLLLFTLRNYFVATNIVDQDEANLKQLIADNSHIIEEFTVLVNFWKLYKKFTEAEALYNTAYISFKDYAYNELMHFILVQKFPADGKSLSAIINRWIKNGRDFSFVDDKLPETAFDFLMQKAPSNLIPLSTLDTKLCLESIIKPAKMSYGEMWSVMLDAMLYSNEQSGIQLLDAWILLGLPINHIMPELYDITPLQHLARCVGKEEMTDREVINFKAKLSASIITLFSKGAIIPLEDPRAEAVYSKLLFEYFIENYWYKSADFTLEPEAKSVLGFLFNEHPQRHLFSYLIFSQILQGEVGYECLNMMLQNKFGIETDPITGNNLLSYIIVSLIETDKKALIEDLNKDYSYFTLVKNALDAGCDPTTTSSKISATPLHFLLYAIRQDLMLPDIMEYVYKALEAKNFNPHVPSKRGLTPKDFALIQAAQLEDEAKIKIFQDIAERLDQFAAKSLLADEKKIEQDIDPLAIYHFHNCNQEVSEILKMKLKAYIDNAIPPQQSGDYYGLTPLHHAVLWNDFSIFFRSLKLNIPIDKKNCFGHSVKFLLQEQAKYVEKPILTLTDATHGHNVLEFIISEGDLDTVEKLINLGWKQNVIFAQDSSLVSACESKDDANPVDMMGEDNDHIL